jgi:hypothetical protein
MNPPTPCPACAHAAEFPEVEKTDSGVIQECTRCGLQFAHPVPPECPIFVDFAGAAAEQFAALARGADLDTILTPTERQAVKWIRRNVPAGGAVLEACFEAGRLLEACRREGFKAYGFDPVEGHVAHLRAHDFEVRQGLFGAVDQAWPDPAAVVMLESLVRFPAPVAVLTDVKRRFPRAKLFISVPSPHRSLKAPGFDRRSDYPPHHLHRWSPISLRAALQAAGYEATVGRTYIDANSLEVPHVVRLGVRLAYRVIGEADYSYYAIGTPR